MSLSATATETDAVILQHLDSATLHKLSLISKYWRETTESFLYRDIKIVHQNRLPLLLRTILGRKKLAEHIQSLSVRALGSEDQLEAWEFFQDQVLAVQSIVASTTRGLPRHISENLVKRIRNDFVCDASLSLILCLAVNLEELDLSFAHAHKHMDFNTYPVLYDVLGTIDWRLVTDVPGTPRPFEKLRTFSLNVGSGEYGRLPMTASLRQVHLSNLAGNSTIEKCLHPGLGTMLHTLTLDNIETDLDYISMEWLSPCFWHLKKLVIRNFPYRDITDRDAELPPPSSWKDMGTWTDDLVRELPELEELELSNIRLKSYDWHKFYSWFQLEDHKTLVKLVIDYELLAKNPLPNEGIGLLHPDDSLPPGLRSITLTRVGDDSLADLLKLYARYAEDPGQAAKFTSALLRVDGIQEFNLELFMLPLWGDPEELSEDAQKMIPCLIDNLQEEEGIEMHVWRQDHKFKKKLLYAPGYEAPLPHWGDLKWSKHHAYIGYSSDESS